MTIDPEDFTKQGAPTVEQVHEVWEATPHPSARKVAEVLNRRGYSITFRTVARYKESNWRPRDKKMAGVGKGERTKPRVEIAKEDKAELMRALARVEATIQPPPPPPAGDDAEPAKVDPEQARRDLEQAAFDLRDTDLMKMTENQLRKLEGKRRLVTNIHILEAMASKSKVMILIPKETSSLVAAMTASISAPVANGKADGSLPGDSAKDVTPDRGYSTIDVTPNESPVADSIAAFRRKVNGIK